jgi:hypothetical protein
MRLLKLFVSKSRRSRTVEKITHRGENFDQLLLGEETGGGVLYVASKPSGQDSDVRKR